MTARVEIERLLTTLAMGRPDFGPYWRGIHDTAHWLRKYHVIRLRTLEAVMAANDIGNGAAHGKRKLARTASARCSAPDRLAAFGCRAERGRRMIGLNGREHAIEPKYVPAPEQLEAERDAINAVWSDDERRTRSIDFHQNADHLADLAAFVFQCSDPL